MSTPEQRKRYRAYHERHEAIFAEWREHEYQYPPPKSEPLPCDLASLTCDAKTRAGTAYKQKAIYINGRCKWHGGLSTGPKTVEGKKRSALNGLCPKKKRNRES